MKPPAIPPALLAPVVRVAAGWVFSESAGWTAIRRRNLQLTRWPGAPRGVSVLPTLLGGVPAEVLRPRAPRADTVLLYLHGGGFTTGSPRTHRALAGRLAQRLRTDTYVLGYRLAPEHPYPAALDDVAAAYRALLAQRPHRRILVAGDSAGAHLTLSLALHARDQKLPAPAVLGLICPAADLTDQAWQTLPEATRDAVLSKKLVRRFLDAYTVDPPSGDLRGLPPIVLDTAEHDLLVDQGRTLAARARAAGVPVHYREHQGLWHDFHIMAGLLPQANRALDVFADALVHHVADQATANPHHEDLPSTRKATA